MISGNPPSFNDVKWKQRVAIANDLLNFLKHWAPAMQKAVFFYTQQIELIII